MNDRISISWKSFCFVLTIFFIFVSATDSFGALQILNIRHWTAPDHTRIVFDVDGEADYQIRQSKDVLILNLQNASVSKNIQHIIILGKPGIKKIIFHPDNKNLKIELCLDKHYRIDVFKLKKFQDKPDRIVADIILEKPTKEPIRVEKRIETKTKRTIIIDPGHGGEDPGAIGKKGSYEKDIVLSISKKIQNAINGVPGYTAVLTRDADYYVSFNKRLQKARDLNASLFISVHADAAKNRNAKGSSVYCLSTGAASSEAAKLLAQNENLADILGGVMEIEGRTESNTILMNMFQTNTINMSKIYAEHLIEHLKKINGIKYEAVQEAPFRVLKLPDIPAVLIETAYISNPDEEVLLKKDFFQKSLAMAVSSSIINYFSALDDSQRTDEIATSEHTIKKGETLFSIARKFNTDIDVILRLNDLRKEDILIVGQKILVPDDQNDLLEKQNETSRIYIVKKGDTLFRIAKIHSTTVKDLLRINNMKQTDTLLYGQKIKVP